MFLIKSRLIGDFSNIAINRQKWSDFGDMGKHDNEDDNIVS